MLRQCFKLCPWFVNVAQIFVRLGEHEKIFRILPENLRHFMGSPTSEEKLKPLVDNMVRLVTC